MIDYFAKDALELKNKKLWLFDMDGTIYKENTLFDGTLNLLNKIKKSGGDYIFVTNNSSQSVFDYVEKVNKLGINVTEKNFFTSSQASILWLKKEVPNAKVYCQGTKSFIDELKKADIDFTEKVSRVDVVLVGFDTELNMQKLRNTCEILSTQNPVYIATNPDLTCPVSFGFIPDCGSLCAMIKNATNKVPIFIGKPSTVMVNIITKKSNCSHSEVVVVGDRLYTDIAMGLNAGVTSVCVLTGEATISEIEHGNIKPDLTFKSVREISDCL